MAALLAILALSGCIQGGLTLPTDTGGGGGDIVGGDGDFGVQITGGSTPQYVWVVAPAYRLRVTRALQPTIVSWEISATDGSFKAPVTHGSAPEDAEVEVANETELISGVRYRVEVYLPDGRIGWNEFTP